MLKASEFDNAHIIGLETDVVRVPLAADYQGSTYHMTHRATIFTRIHTDIGIVGETYTADEDDTNTEIQQIVHAELAPKLIGTNPLAISERWRSMRPSSENVLRDRRVGLVATATIDQALWDIFGNAVGLPLWRLWGGYSPVLHIICTGGYYGTSQSIEDEIRQVRDTGYYGMKFKVGARSPEEDAERFIRAREAAGEDFVMVADANQSWTVDEAVRFVHLVKDYDLYYFEEPCQWENDVRSMRDVRYLSAARINAGQSEFSAVGCRRLMDEGAIDFCNFDNSWTGGPTVWRSVAAIASTYGVRMGHHEEAQISAHLLASVEGGTFVDTFLPDRDPIWWNMIVNRPEIHNGAITLNDRPGLGWIYDHDYIQKFSVSHLETGDASV